MPLYVDVAVPLGVRKTFAYSVPAPLHGRIEVGARVTVPFGRRLLTGFVVGIGDLAPAGNFKIRPVRELQDAKPVITADLVETALWAAGRYFAPPGETLRAIFPVGAQPAGLDRFLLSDKAARLLEGGLRPPQLHAAEESLMEILHHEGRMTLKQLRNRSGRRDAREWLERLIEKEWVCLECESGPARVSEKLQLGIRLLVAPGSGVEGRLTPAQERILGCLGAGEPPQILQPVLRRAKAGPSAARTLAARGVVEIRPMKIHRLPADLKEAPARRIHALTDAQQGVLSSLISMISDRRPHRCLLHGVTGSGKTEIYLRLIAEVLARDGTALFLVPEIGLTPLLSRIAVSHFPDKVALLHSGMPAGERFDQWNRIRKGEAPVVVGTRSAVFAPLDHLRLIIIDEEQDPSYKQDESPCYHAREVAWHRVQRNSGVLLMGSATPSIESYYDAAETNEVRHFCLPQRIEARPMPDVRVVDMSVEFQRHGHNTVISGLLLAGLRERLDRGEQSMILLNRRGYSRSLLCRSCGQSTECPDCSVSMTYHQNESLLVCHYCGKERPVPSNCESCGGGFVYFVGVGTEQLEEILRKMLPGARIARLDRDSTRRRGTLRKALLDFSAGKTDILVGTQMLAKGHDFPNVTLVGVVGADSGLSFPDFRSAERVFQLLTQVAGRAGRGAVPGRVVIQSFYPDHYALRFARAQDYQGFFRHEIEFRRLLAYPPFSRLIQILISDRDRERAHKLGERIVTALKDSAGRTGVLQRLRILGPAAAPIEKLRGKFRIQILLKILPGADGLPALQTAFLELAERKTALKNVRVDVDPLSIL